MPLTAGFVGKFYVISAGAGASLWLLLVSLAVNSAVGLFYYLRVIAVLFGATDDENRSRHVPLSPENGLIMVVLTLLLIGLGVYPGPLIDLLQATVAGLM
jgi:NADH-quinone oxidoreductase subunit N